MLCNTVIQNYSHFFAHCDVVMMSCAGMECDTRSAGAVTFDGNQKESAKRRKEQSGAEELHKLLGRTSGARVT
jgi:hypothetical protein